MNRRAGWLALGLVACGDARLADEAAALCDGCDACAVDHPSVDGAQHVEGGVDYADLPPAGGDHDPCWTGWGVHAVDPGDEHWVHNLEHGGVVFLYRCPDGCPDEVVALEALVADLPPGTAILTPYEALPTAFAAVAWGHRLLTDCFDDRAMRGFYDLYVDQAPESVQSPPPGGCAPTTP